MLDLKLVQMRSIRPTSSLITSNNFCPEETLGMMHSASLFSDDKIASKLSDSSAAAVHSEGKCIGMISKLEHAGVCAACNEKVMLNEEAACGLRNSSSLEVRELFHARCMLCSKCGRTVEETDSKCCFTATSSRKLVCKFCQYRLRHCHQCGHYVNSDSWVHKMQDGLPFHISCFSCSMCHRQLSHGEECAMHKDKLLCLEHYNEAVNGRVDGDFEHSSRHKNKRVRTSFTPEQLHILQNHFEMDHNPDGSDLEKIAQSASLNKRVTQVWFQNARARKKKTERVFFGRDRSDTSDFARHLSDDGNCSPDTVCDSPSPAFSPLSNSDINATYNSAVQVHCMQGLESCY